MVAMRVAPLPVQMVAGTILLLMVWATVNLSTPVMDRLPVVLAGDGIPFSVISAFILGLILVPAMAASSGPQRAVE